MTNFYSINLLHQTSLLILPIFVSLAQLPNYRVLQRQPHKLDLITDGIATVLATL
jgi:hypothetical protein